MYISDEDSPMDIITFYNQVFLKKVPLKEIIANIRNGTSSTTALNNVTNKNSKKNTLLMSPMKAIIPKDLNFKTKNLQNGKGKNNNLTPQNQFLYAYNESPLLKYDVSSFKAPLKSKKVLNY